MQVDICRKAWKSDINPFEERGQTMKIDEFRKRKEARAKEIEKMTGNLEKLRFELDEIETAINAAIDSENLSMVEQLTEHESEIEHRIKAAEKILERKREKSAVSPEEVISANNEDMQKYQKQIDDLMKTADKQRRAYYETLIHAGEIVGEALSIRNEYLDISESSISSDSLKEVHAGYTGRPFGTYEVEYINGIAPDGVKLINLLRR